jgi:glycosyltransferase involved in cell wall biosynthesis
MNIVFLLDRLTVGGAERQTCVVVDALAARGHHASMMMIAGERPANFPPEILPARTRFLGRSKVWTLSGLLQLGRELRATGAEIVAPVNQTALVACVLARVLGLHSAKIVCVFHTTVIATQVGRLKLPIFYAALRLADGIVYVSENQRRYWEGRGLKARLSEAITNGIVAETFAPATPEERAAARGTWSLTPDDVVVALCARFHPEKNQQELVHAAGALIAAGQPVKLLFVGDGPTRPTVKAVAEGLGIVDHVIFAGEHRSVRPLLAAADVFVLSSNAVETFSIAALEAMAMMSTASSIRWATPRPWRTG